MDFKMWVLQGHYRGERNFSFSDLKSAKTRRLNWRNQIAKTYQTDIKSTISTKQILEAVSDNLNSPKAFSLVDNHELSFKDWQFIDELFGLQLIQDSPDLSATQKNLISARQTARQAKDYVKSDQIRDALLRDGIVLNDSTSETTWSYNA